MTASKIFMGLLIALAIAFAPGSAAAAEVCDAQGVCVDGAQWIGGDQLNDKARAREAKRNRKKKDASLTVELVSELGEARASVFLDGVWVAAAPIEALALKPGKHDLEVRDGERVLARGVLVIGKNSGDVRVRIGG